MSTQLRPPKQMIPLPRGVNPKYKFDINRSMYNEAERPEYSKSNVETVETKFSLHFHQGSYRMSTTVRSIPDVDIAIAIRQPDIQESATEHFRVLAEKLCEKYQGISINENVLGGMPHIKGFRISVPHILTHLYHLGSVDAVVADFEQRISKEQVKEAIAYAHDFMEIACDPSEDDD